MSTKRTLLRDGCVLTLDPAIGNFHKADVLIEGTKIVRVAPGIEAGDAEVIDASNTVVMPGFVDSHRHMWEGILRNIGTDVPLEGDVSYLAFILNTLAPVYRPEDAYCGDLISAYHRRLTSPDEATRLTAARAWSVWEGATSFLHPDPAHIASSGEDQFALAFARIECHYFVNAGFFEVDGQLLRDAHRLRGIPATIVQGRYDVVCPLRSAWDLHCAWPEADLRIVADAGHSAFEPGITHELVQATDRYR